MFEDLAPEILGNKGLVLPVVVSEWFGGIYHHKYPIPMNFLIPAAILFSVTFAFNPSSLDEKEEKNKPFEDG